MSYSSLFRTTTFFPLDEVFATAALPPILNYFRPSSHVLLAWLQRYIIFGEMNKESGEMIANYFFCMK